MTIPQAIYNVKEYLHNHDYVSNEHILSLFSADQVDKKTLLLDIVRNQLIQANYAEDYEQLGLRLSPIQKEPTYDVFMSYARKDNCHLRMDELYEIISTRYFIKSGRTLRIFYDTREIQGGDNWQLRLGDGIKQSKIMIAVLSENYFNSFYCHWEWERYHQQEVGIGLLDEGILPVIIYLTEPENSTIKDKKEWKANLLTKRQFINIADWFEEGEKVFLREGVQKRFDSLNDFCISRIHKINRINHSQGTLPRHFSHFYGRQNDLRNMLDLLNCKNPPVLALYGMPGIGKSTLAYEYGLAYADRYAGGRFFIKASGMLNIIEALKTLMETAFGWTFNKEEKKKDHIAYIRIKRHFEEPHRKNASYYTLLIFDNVEKPGHQFNVKDIADWIPLGVHVIITSRQKPNESQLLKTISVQPLDLNASLQLLNSYRAFLNEEERNIGKIVSDKLEGYPLALNLAGIFLQKKPNLNYQNFLIQLEKDNIGALDKMGNALDKMGNEITGKIELYEYKEKVISHLISPLINSLNAEEKRAIEYAALLPSDSVPLPWIEDLLKEDFPESFGGTDEDDWFSLSLWDNIKLKLITFCIWNETEEAKLVRMHRILQEIVKKDLPENFYMRVSDKVSEKSNELDGNWFKKEEKWAVESLRKYVSSIENDSYNNDNKASICNNLALIEHRFGNLKRAKHLMEKAIDITEFYRSPVDPTLAIQYSNLALIERDSGNIHKAKELLGKAANIAEAISTRTHPKLALMYSNLSMTEARIGNLSRAKELMEKAVKINELNYEPLHPVMEKSYANLAMLERDLGNTERARQLMERSLGIAKVVYELNHPVYITRYSHFADVEKASGNVEKAREYYKKSIEIAEANYYGPVKLELMQSYHALAKMEYDKGNLNESKELFEKALKIAHKLYEPNHIRLAAMYRNYGMIEYNSQNKTNAIKLLEKSAGIYETNREIALRELILVYYDLIDIEFGSGNLSKAKNYLEKAIKVTEDKLGPSHPSLAAMHSKLAIINQKLGIT